MRLGRIRCALDRLVEACPCRGKYRYNIERTPRLDGHEREVHRRGIRVFRRARDTIIYVYGCLGRIYVSEVIAGSGACDIPSR